MNFWITLRKFRHLSGNFDTMFFYKSMKKYFSKSFVKISANFWKTFVTVGQGYDKLFTNGISLYCTKIYKLLVVSQGPCKLRLCERPRACKSAGTLHGTALTFGK